MEPEPEIRCLEISADAKTICEITEGIEPISWKWVKTGDLQSIIDQLEERGWTKQGKKSISTGVKVWVRKKSPTMGAV
jgi:hypothetical protein